MAELFPYSGDTVRGTVLAMSATHAEKNRMGVREGVMEWDRGCLPRLPKENFVYAR